MKGNIHVDRCLKRTEQLCLPVSAISEGTLYSAKKTQKQTHPSSMGEDCDRESSTRQFGKREATRCWGLILGSFVLTFFFFFSFANSRFVYSKIADLCGDHENDWKCIICPKFTCVHFTRTLIQSLLPWTTSLLKGKGWAPYLYFYDRYLYVYTIFIFFQMKPF